MYNVLPKLTRKCNFTHTSRAIPNSLGGLRPDTVAANISGDIKSFWKVLNDQGQILNWSGEVNMWCVVVVVVMWRCLCCELVLYLCGC